MGSTDNVYALGIDLGGTSVKAVALTESGRLLAERNVPFDAEQTMDWARVIAATIEDLQAQQNRPHVRIGLSAPGLAAPDGRSIAYMPGRLEGLTGLDWTDFLESDEPVPVLNDAHAALWGEVWQGAAKGLQNVIMLTLGTGVGGAAMVDGRLLRGHTGKAGHLGHTCLDPEGPPDVCGIPGSLEWVIGNDTIEERSGGRFHSTHDLIAAHRAGDPNATAIWMKSLHGLACAIGSFTNILDPEAVIIGGGIARAADALFEPLRHMVADVEWKVSRHQVKLLPAQLGELAGAYGAARRALDESHNR